MLKAWGTCQCEYVERNGEIRCVTGEDDEVESIDIEVIVDLHVSERGFAQHALSPTMLSDSPKGTILDLDLHQKGTLFIRRRL